MKKVIKMSDFLKTGIYFLLKKDKLVVCKIYDL